MDFTEAVSQAEAEGLPGDLFVNRVAELSQLSTEEVIRRLGELFDDPDGA